MTPKRFFDSEGGPFAHTVLDDRAGVRHAQAIRLGTRPSGGNRTVPGVWPDRTISLSDSAMRRSTCSMTP